MDPAAPPPLDRRTIAAILATCERWTAEKEAELTRRQADLAQLTEQVRDIEADVQQARILIEYLRARLNTAELPYRAP